MDQQQAQNLLSITQQNDYTWQAILPEMPMMWQTGHSEAEAIANWQKEYDQPFFAQIFAQVLQQRAEHPPLVPHVPERQTSIQRPPTVDFPYRGRLYRMETNEGLPKRHIVLSNGTILVVCGWNGRSPATLSDIRRSPEPMHPSRIAAQLDALEAFEIPMAPDYSVMARPPRDLRIRFSYRDEKYIVSDEAYEQRMGILFISDHGYFRIKGYLESMPVKLAGLQSLAGPPPPSEKVAVALRLADAVDVDPWEPAG